jgi:hypothetical protein
MQPLPEQVPDTWSTKALPFLRSAVIRFETYGRATGDEIPVRQADVRHLR